MQAPWSDQLKLLEVQNCDTAISQLSNQLKKLPELARQQELAAKQSELHKKAIQVNTIQAEQERKQKTLEQELKQVRDRRSRQQERLDQGQASASELLSLQKEIAALEQRIQKLEDQQLELLAQAEKIENIQALVQTRKTEFAEEMSQIEKIIGEKSQDLESQRSKLAAERAQLVENIHPPLLAAYDRVRAQTGGVGAIKLVGTRSESIPLDLSAAEASKILQAKPEEVIFSEDFDYILVRCPE